MKLSRAAVFALLVAGAAHGENSFPPPAWPVPDIKPSGTKIQPATGITLGSFHVTFEKTTFNDILSALGTAPIGQQGDAGGFLMWVCYTVPAAHARIWLTSSELGGLEYIDGMVAERFQGTDADNPLCPSPISQTAPISIDNGIWLGEPIEKIKGILGAPNKAPASVVYYLYEGRDGEFDISSVLALKVRKGRITEIHANHSATN
jgi:hypothetical protein